VQISTALLLLVTRRLIETYCTQRSTKLVQTRAT